MKKLALVLVAVFGLSVVALANEHEGTAPATEKHDTAKKHKKMKHEKHEKSEKTETKTEEHK